MRGTFNRVAVCVVSATAVAGVAAGQASAAVFPACAAKLAAPATGQTVSCSFQENSGWAQITVAPVATTVTATVRCVLSGGSTLTSSRTVSAATIWFTRTPGYCTLELSSTSPTAVAIATASPWFPIY